ncbi:DoxX family protein [Euzebya sp.]|uniref:DoxX family protein n=1 Tax=Euzebya sp. TaxID=1971409 RepID=UPI0035147BF8
MSGAVEALGRVALAAPFVVLGWAAAREPGGRVQLAADLGVPDPELAVRANGAAMVAGGLAIATGRMSRLAGLGLATSLVPTTLAAHRYWEMDDPAQRGANRINFYKNVGLLGAALVIAGRR